MDLISTAHGEWHGTLAEGTGSFVTGGASVSGHFSVASRFQGEQSDTLSNPEELLAAAHAGCFSMALTSAISKSGATPDNVKTDAKIVMESVDGKSGIGSITLTTVATASGLEADQLTKLAEETLVGCPVSKALSAVPMSVSASLVTV